MESLFCNCLPSVRGIYKLGHRVSQKYKFEELISFNIFLNFFVRHNMNTKNKNIAVLTAASTKSYIRRKIRPLLKLTICYFRL